MAKNNLYNLSHYATTYHTDKGEKRGIMLSGYRVNDDDEHEYVNLWLPARDCKLIKGQDGKPVLQIPLVEVTSRESGKKSAKTAKRDNPKEEKPALEEAGDDEFPF